MARNVSGSFTGTGTSDEIVIPEIGSVSLSGFGSATVVLERSGDEGITWKTVATYTADGEAGVLGIGWKWRLNCTVHGSGTIVYFLGSPS
jgi:hypothetical protein